MKVVTVDKQDCAGWNGCAGAILPSCKTTEGTLGVIEKRLRFR
jgi:hypothetical protein